VLGKGFATVGVGPESAVGMIKARKNDNSAIICGANRAGCEEQRGVSEIKNVFRCTFGRDGRVSSIGYSKDKHCDSWCVSEAVRYDTQARRAANRT
jgi:hypothetical protein